jgi:hypothetical protein
MLQKPSTLGMMLCDQVVFEQGTQKPFILGVFTGMAVESFPSQPRRFDLYASLTDGMGYNKVVLTVVHLEADEDIYS